VIEMVKILQIWT